MKAEAAAGLSCCAVAWSLRAAIFEFWAAEGILKAAVEPDVRTAVAEIPRVRARRIVK